jgi:hypothetical protein
MATARPKPKSRTGPGPGPKPSAGSRARGPQSPAPSTPGNPPGDAPARPNGNPQQSARLVAEVRAGLGVTREFFARLTGFSVRAIAGWEAGRPLGEAGRRRILEMGRLRDLLAEGMRPEFISRWLESPCEGLGGLKPVEVLERGEADRLWRVALLIGSGMPT